MTCQNVVFYCTHQEEQDISFVNRISKLSQHELITRENAKKLSKIYLKIHVLSIPVLLSSCYAMMTSQSPVDTLHIDYAQLFNQCVVNLTIIPKTKQKNAPKSTMTTITT
jgi:hypothetical protein